MIDPTRRAAFARRLAAGAARGLAAARRAGAGAGRRLGPAAERARARLRRRGARLTAAGRALGGYGPAALVVALALAAVWPAVTAPGLIATRAGGDSPFLLQRVHEMALALRAGHVPPRWMPDAAFGLGYPFWNYYAPLAYLAAGAVALLGGGVVGAIKLTQAACFVAAALGAYRLGRATWGTAAAGTAAAAVATFAPYHLLNVYVRGDALAELAAYAVAPWLLVGIDDVVVRPTARGAARLAVLAAALPLAHNVSALLYAPLALLFALWRLDTRRRLRRAAAVGPVVAGGGGGDAALASAGVAPAADGAAVGPRARASLAGEASTTAAGGRRPIAPPAVATSSRAVPPGSAMDRAVAMADAWRVGLERRGWRLWRAAGSPLGALSAAAVLGAGLAAWFWVPALVEQRAVQLAGNTSGFFDFRNHFLAVVDLEPVLGPRGDASGPIGLARSLVAGPALLEAAPFVDYGTDGGVPATTGLAVLAVALAGAAVASRARPRRAALAFWGAAAAAATLLTTALSWPVWAALEPLAWVQFPWRWLNVQALALAVLAGGLGAGPGGARRGRWAAVLAAGAAVVAAGLGRLPIEVLPIDQPTRADLEAFEHFSGNLGTTVRGEYVPWAVSPRPASSVHAVAGLRVGPRAVDSAVVEATLVRDDIARQTWQVDIAGEAPRTLAWPLWWFPGWLATVDDGPPRATAALDGSGWLTAEVPPGRHLVTLALQRTTVRAVAEVVSLLALGLVAVLWLSGRGPLRLGRRAAGLVLGLAGAVLVARALPLGARSGLTTLDWPRMPYPHGNPDGLRFGPNRLVGARFEGVDDVSAPIDAGGALSIALDWEAPAAGQTATLALASPADAPLGLDEDWSTAQEPVTTTVGATLPVPPETPGGLWFVRLTVRDDRGAPVPATNAAGHRLDAVYLGPLRIRAVERSPATPPAGPVLDAGAVALDEVRWSQADDRLALRLTWRAEQFLTADFKTSVRLLRGGEPIAQPDGAGPVQVDQVPGYGANPPTAWPVARPVEDRRWLRLPPGLSAGNDYQLDIVVYDAWTAAELGRGRVEGVVLEAVPAGR